jgi:hypothetical protein
MQLRYHYSIAASFLFLGLGGVFLFFGLDLLIFHEVIREADAPPAFVAMIALFFGMLLSSGFFMNLIKGKEPVLEADAQGITVHTKSVNGQLPQIRVAWQDVIDLKVKRARSVFHADRRDHSTKAVVIAVKPGLIEWPSVMIAKNRISFQRGDDHDELVIDAWLNKSKAAIVDEITQMGRSVNPEIPS